jgi:hypothetical protein
MATALQCSNAACGKVENVPDGVLAPTSCLACGAPLSPADAAAITTHPVALLVQPPPAQEAEATGPVTDAPAGPSGGEPAWLADEKLARRKRPPRIPATTPVPKLFIFGFELTLGGLFRVVLPLALLVGVCVLAFWAATRVVSDTSGSLPAGQPTGRR